MIPIYLQGLGGPHGYMLKDFVLQLKYICAEHQREGRASAFALILHDEGSPEVSKALRDPDYWAALDKISGRALTVFSMHSMVVPYENDEQNPRKSGFVRGTDRRLRQSFAKYFDLEAVPFPVLLFFQVFEDRIAGTIFVGLKQSTVESTFIEIKEAIQEAAVAVLDDAGKRITDPLRAFERVEAAIKRKHLKAVLKVGIGNAMSIGEFLGALFPR